MADVKYHDFFKECMNKKIDCASGGDVFKLQLHTSAYTPNADHAVKADLSGEHAASGNYATGGYAFTNTNNALTDDDGADKALFDIAEDAVWASSTIVNARYGILVDDTPSSPADPLVGCFDFGADKNTSNGTFTVQFNASGIIDIA